MENFTSAESRVNLGQRMIEVRQEREPSFSAYAAVSAAFTVRSRLHVESLTGGPEGSSLAEVPVRPPSVKDYSAAAGSPARWPELFDVARPGRVRRARRGRTRRRRIVDAADEPATLIDLRVSPTRRPTAARPLRVAWKQHPMSIRREQ